MTNEEMERAIDFLLKSQANLEVRIEQTNEQLARTDEQLARTDEQLARTNEQLARTNEQVRQLTEQVSVFADTQNQFIQVVTRTFEAQAQINESLRAGQARTEEALARLADAQAHTDRRLDALIDIVQGRLNGQ